MDHVQPPERGNRVEHHVLQVDHQIEGEHGWDHLDPKRPAHLMEQTPTARLSDCAAWASDNPGMSHLVIRLFDNRVGRCCQGKSVLRF
jgi:hypothetical protein